LSPDATPLLDTGGGLWVVEIALPPGRHEYRFIVDGAWVNDPQAVETVSNDFDSVNDVLVLE